MLPKLLVHEDAGRKYSIAGMMATFRSRKQDSDKEAESKGALFTRCVSVACGDLHSTDAGLCCYVFVFVLCLSIEWRRVVLPVSPLCSMRSSRAMLVCVHVAALTTVAALCSTRGAAGSAAAPAMQGRAALVRTARQRPRVLLATHRRCRRACAQGAGCARASCTCSRL
jgi:hypothetical protein